MNEREEREESEEINQIYDFSQNQMNQQILSFIQQTAQSQNQLSNFQSLQLVLYNQFTSIAKMQTEKYKSNLRIQKIISNTLINHIQISILNKNFFRENSIHSLAALIYQFTLDLKTQLKRSKYKNDHYYNQLVNKLLEQLTASKQSRINQKIKKSHCPKLIHIQQNKYLAEELQLFFNSNEEFANLENFIVKLGRQIGKIIDLIGKVESFSNLSLKFQKFKSKLKQSASEKQFDKIFNLTSQQFCKLFNKIQVKICQCDEQIILQQFENQKKNKNIKSQDKNYKFMSASLNKQNKQGKKFNIKTPSPLKKLQKNTQSNLEIQEKKKERYKSLQKNSQQIIKFQQENHQARKNRFISQKKAVYQNKRKNPLKLREEKKKITISKKEEQTELKMQKLKEEKVQSLHESEQKNIMKS